MLFVIFLCHNFSTETLETSCKTLDLDFRVIFCGHTFFSVTKDMKGNFGIRYWGCSFKQRGHHYLPVSDIHDDAQASYSDSVVDPESDFHVASVLAFLVDLSRGWCPS